MHRISYDSIITLLILQRSDFRFRSGSSMLAPSAQPLTRGDVPPSAAFICCVSSCPVTGRSAPVKGGVVILGVVHFRKLRKARKVGSERNGRPVI
jgi:hypothetical protein